MRRISCALLAGTAVLAVTASPAFAQDAPAAATPAAQPDQTNDGSNLDDIVVTAQKRSERLQDVPLAVTALTGGDLATANVDGQLTLPKITPNLNFTLLSTFAAAYIRGVGTQYANPGLEASVSVYYDDSYLPRATSGIFNFNDIERIEVLKGPQGTLYGRNATGGAIRIVTRDPVLKEFQGSLDATYGSYNRIMVGGVANIPVGDNAAFRFAAQHDQNDGYVTNSAPTGPRKLQDRNAEIYSGKFLWKAGGLSIKLSGDYESKKDGEGFAFTNLFRAPVQVGEVLGGCVSKSFYNVCNDARRSQGKLEAWGLGARIDYDFGRATVSSISSFRKINEDSAADLDGTGNFFQHSHGVTATKQFTQELQIVSGGSGPLKYTGGLFYLHEESFYNYYVFGGAIDGGFGALGSAFGIGSTNILFSAQGPGLKVDSYAPYLQLDYDVTDKFTVSVGARYTKEKKSLIGNYPGLAIRNAQDLPTPGTFIGASTIGLAGIPGLGGVCKNPGDTLCSTGPETVRFNNFTPKLTLSYKPSSELLLYVTASRGFKAGGLALPAFGYVDQVKPEILDDLEGGWKYQSGKIRFNGSVFYYWYKDLQLPIVNATTGTTNTRNAANARSYGIEADLTYKVTPELEVGMGGGYVNARFTDFVNGPGFAPAVPVGGTTTTITNLKGFSLQNAPDFTGYAKVQYNVPLNGNGQLQFGSILNYRSKAYFDVANQFPDQARALLSAKVMWVSENEKFSIGVYGENLTGKKYFTNVTPLGNGGFTNPGAPRQIYVTAGVKF